MRKIVIALAVVGIAILGFFLWKEGKTEDKVAIEYSKLEKELIPLNVEKRKLDQELSAVEREDKEDKRERGTVILLFTELDEKVYTEIYPKMKECGYRGVLALSTEEFPGEKGCMTEKQFKKLLKEGWTYCITWDKSRSIDVWEIFMQQKVAKLKLEKPAVMYFPTNTYKKAHNESLKEYGYQIIVHHGERNLSLYPKTTKKEEFWYPGVCGMSGEGPKTKLRDVATSGKNIVYTVGFSRKDEMYEKATFERMLQEFQKHEKDEEILVKNFEEARQYHMDIKEKQKGVNMTIEEQKAEIQKRIDEVEGRIDKLYAKYTK